MAIEPSWPQRGLYAIVDPERCGGRPLERVAEAVLRGGAAVLQLRAKRLDDRARLALAQRLAALCTAWGVPFVVDDRVDLAVLCGARGVHLGQRDLPLQAARRLAPSLHVGCSTHDEAQLREALAAGADIVAFGPVHPTRTKDDPDPTVGLGGLERAARLVDRRVPLVAIGGITAERAAAVVAAGADMVAVISALGDAEDPERAARRFAALFR